MSNNGKFSIYLLLSSLFLVMQAFQGLSFLDIGMYMSGYQHFNEEPQVTYYLGQWLLTYQLTGWLCQWLHADTFMGLRLMHIALLAAMQTGIYLYLRRLIPVRYIIGGLALAVLAHFGSYLDISYNSYSAMLLVFIILCYHRGVTARRHAGRLLLAAGILAGIAVFFRAVNLTFLSLPLYAMLTRRLFPHKVSATRQFACFYGGAAAGMAVVMGIEAAMGMTDILLQTGRDLASIGGNGDDPHSLKNIVIGAYTIYKNELAQAGILCILTALTAIAIRRSRSAAGTLAVKAVLVALMTVNVYYWEEASNVTVAICLIGAAIMVAGKNVGHPAASLYALSLFIPLVYPIGSNGGAAFVGPFLCFLPLPLAVWAIGEGADGLPGYARCCRHALQTAFWGICCALVFTNVMRPMMEDGNRMACRYAISDCPVTKHICTTRENADMYHHLLQELQPLIPRGSYLVCNFSLPIISMMDCKPFAVFSDVFTNDRMNDRYLSAAMKHSGGMPYILADRATIRPGFEHVQDVLMHRCQYDTIWQENEYILMKPQIASNE